MTMMTTRSHRHRSPTTASPLKQSAIRVNDGDEENQDPFHQHNASPDDVSLGEDGKSIAKDLRDEVESEKISTEDAIASGAVTVVDAGDHIDKSSRQAPRSSLVVPKDRNANLRDLAKMLQKSTRFAHVTPEQVERVRAMHDRFADGAKFSFNYNVLLLVASVLAGFGLASDSSTIVIASMLVSPIMGPVVGMAYGATIRDWKLVRRSLRTETISLIFCVAAGAAIGAICGPTVLADEWPTQEMRTRGTWENFLVGLPVAFFSGLGVAVSLLDDQTSSLVGVAISASLLPPAVDAGLIWVAYAFVKHDSLGTLPEKYKESGDYVTHNHFREAAFIALLLTLANIALIWAASMLMFRMKEVLPIEKKVFWTDLGVARAIYQKRALLSETNPSNTTASEDQDKEIQSAPTLVRFADVEDDNAKVSALTMG